jgi:hypothetical protein
VDDSPSARERAGDALAEPPPVPFDVVVAQDGADLSGIRAERRIIVKADGSVLG